jgi:hypothetical protein
MIKPNNTVKAALVGLPADFITWLESMRNKNPMTGSKDGMNTNSVFCEIGKNIIIDTILEERDKAIHPRASEPKDAFGSDLMSGPVSM